MGYSLSIDRTISTCWSGPSPREQRVRPDRVWRLIAHHSAGASWVMNSGRALEDASSERLPSSLHRISRMVANHQARLDGLKVIQQHLMRVDLDTLDDDPQKPLRNLTLASLYSPVRAVETTTANARFVWGGLGDISEVRAVTW